MLWALPVVLCLLSTHVSIGPDGPVIDAVGLALKPSGIIAITGRPAPVVPQPHICTGLGDSAMNFVRLVTVPLPGNRIGALNDRRWPRPRRMSSVAPECQRAALAFSHWP